MCFNSRNFNPAMLFAADIGVGILEIAMTLLPTIALAAAFSPLVFGFLIPRAARLQPSRLDS